MASPSVTGLAAPIPSRYTEGTWHSPGYRNGSTRARWAQGLFIAAALASVLEAFMALWGVSVMGEAMNGSLTSTEATSFLGTANGVDGLYLWCAIGLAIAFLAWLSRTVEIVPALGAGTPHDSPRWAIGWWFVPIAFLWKPYTVVREVWDRLATSTRAGDAKLVLAWWLTWLGSTLVARFAMSSANSASTTLSSAQSLFVVVAFAEIGSTTAAVLGFLVVREIQARASERALGLGFDAPLPSAAAPLPSAAAPLPSAAAPLSTVSGPALSASSSDAPASGTVAAAYCPNCGTLRPAGALFCGTCGRSASSAAESPIAQQGTVR